MMRRKSKYKLKVFFAILLLALLCVIFCFNFSRAANEYAEYDLKNAVIESIYEAFGAVCDKFEAELPNIQRSILVNGEVNALAIDSLILNKITAELTFEASRRLENMRSSFSLPLGNATGIELFSGKGPGIKLTVVPLGSVCAATESKFISAGINQTLHRISVRIDVLINVLAPFCSAEKEISCVFALCETLIIGKVPELYFMRDETP